MLTTKGSPPRVVAVATMEHANRVLPPKKEVPLTHVPIDWSNCGLAQRYPTWEMYWESLDHERQEAAIEGREPHPAAAAKVAPEHPGRPTPKDIAPADQVTSAGYMKRHYGTRD